MNTLPRWAYIALGVACIPMGFWASYITLEYFKHGAAALEADPQMQALAIAAALMFVVSEMSAFGLAALLTEAQLWARRWMLTAFAVSVLALEVCTIIAVQLALTVGADMTQTTILTQEKDLRARIAAIEDGAAAKRADAALQRAAGQITKGSSSADRAVSEHAKTTALYEQLAVVQSQKRPTLVVLLGEKWALSYAIARGVLVSLGGLVFFGVAGALLRMGRAIAAPGAYSPAPQVKPPQPGESGKSAPLPDWTTRMPNPGTAYAATIIPAGAAFSPMAVTASPLPTPPSISVPSAPRQSQTAPQAQPAPPEAPEIKHEKEHEKEPEILINQARQVAHDSATAVPAAAHETAQPAPAAPAPQPAPAPQIVLNQARSEDAQEGAQQAAPEPAKQARERAAKAPTADTTPQIDTGIGEHDGYRYRRIVIKVKAGLKPSVSEIMTADEPCGGEVARRYQAGMLAEGVIERKGNSYVLAAKYRKQGSAKAPAKRKAKKAEPQTLA